MKGIKIASLLRDFSDIAEWVNFAYWCTFIGGGSLVSARRPVGTASVGEVLEMNFDNKWWRGTVTHVNALTHEVTLYFESDGESVTCKSMDPDLRRCT